MFYSHTFLAKKSPLGTVWIAAHLERRIKKHQVDEIDIPSYADCIMYPEVPIALRLSGHLLYGLVKIYSLKVNYIYQDCNRTMSDFNVFASVQIDLPEGAKQATFESVTLPTTFDLDAMELDDVDMGGPDIHLKAYDQITIQGEQYVSITINEDNLVYSTPHASISDHGSTPMEVDPLPQTHGQLHDIAPRNETNLSGSSVDLRYHMENDILPPFEDEDLAPNNEGIISNGPPEIMRDAVHNAETEFVDTINDINGDKEQSIHSTNRNVSLSPIIEGLSVSNEGSLPSLTHDNGPRVAPADDLDIVNMDISLGPQLPEVELQPSPVANQQMRNQRRRRQHFDEAIVLNNAEMKKQIEDSTKLVCKRRKLPCSALDVWKHNKLHKNENIFHEPLITGMCTTLQELYGKKFPPLRSKSTSHEASDEHIDAPDIDPVLPEMEMAPEIPRCANNANDIANDFLQPSPPREDLTPNATNNLDSASGISKNLDTEILPTFENPASVNPDFLDFPTPSLNFDEQLNFDDTNIGDIPTLQNSADVEGLSFLQSSFPSSGYDVTKDDTMPASTRKVAQYLKELSPAQTPDNPGFISLFKILEGKRRKQCARMFFETLVLKSYDYIDVQQEAAYGDVLISRTAKFSSFKF